MEKIFMQEAFKEAEKACKSGEVPVGAVIVKDGTIISRAYNQREKLNDPSAHAEMIAIRRASKKIKNWRLEGFEMYVTLEPCVMCMGAILESRISRLVYGADDEAEGAAGSLLNLADMPGAKKRIKVKSGVLKEKCENLLKEFFSARR
ncbi:MAG: tRNA adenosine(34) deaminase TadA [Patescibacteria group bacterium]|nr:tRNA adenosine(34) deaminase TadA [Patescibacteria group bacterium]